MRFSWAQSRDIACFSSSAQKLTALPLKQFQILKPKRPDCTRGASRRGWLDGRAGNESLWFFTGHILQASGGIRTRRSACPDAQTTRPPNSAQTHRSDYGLRILGQSIRQTGQIYQVVPANSGKIWPFSTSPQYRTSDDPSTKKRALKIRVVRKN